MCFETNSFIDNFGIDANYTYSDSSQDSKDVHGNDLPFVGMSKDTYNFVLWYEQDAFSTRLAYNFRSPRLITQGSASTGGQSLYQDDYAQLDFERKLPLLMKILPCILTVRISLKKFNKLT